LLGIGSSDISSSYQIASCEDFHFKLEDSS
jgi:hypothetical protein